MATAFEPTRDGVLVPLHHGPTVPLLVISYLIDGESRGLTFRAEPDGRLHIGPKHSVTPADLAFVKKHRDVILACVTYTSTAEVM